MLRLVAAPMLLALQGCQSIGYGSGPVAPPALLPVDESVPVVQVNQRLTVMRKGHEERQLVAVLAIGKPKMAIHGFDELGIPVFRASYNGETVSSWALPDFDGPVPVRWLLSEIQLAYWPEERLRHGYEDGWSFFATQRQRILKLRDQRVVTVVCQLPAAQQKACFRPGSDVMIKHDGKDFEIRVEALTIHSDGNSGERP